MLEERVRLTRSFFGLAQIRGLTHVGLIQETPGGERREADYVGYHRAPVDRLLAQGAKDSPFGMVGTIGATQTLVALAFYDGPDPGRPPLEVLDTYRQAAFFGCHPTIRLEPEEGDPC